MFNEELFNEVAVDVKKSYDTAGIRHQGNVVRFVLGRSFQENHLIGWLHRMYHLSDPVV